MRGANPSMRRFLRRKSPMMEILRQHLMKPSALNRDDRSFATLRSHSSRVKPYCQGENPWSLVRQTSHTLCFCGSRDLSTTAGAGIVGGGISTDEIATTAQFIQPLEAQRDGSQLLDEAAAEGRRIYEYTNTTKQKGFIRDENFAGKGEGMTLAVQNLSDSADGLLGATRMTVPLARFIAHNTNDERVSLVHRTFLSIIQSCLLAMSAPTDATKSSESTSITEEFLSLDPPLLDKILRLSVRARELGLPFHLPLHESIATAIAQHSHSSSLITKWIQQVGRWAQEDFGANFPPDFFVPTLLALAERRRLIDLADVLLSVQVELDLHYFSEEATTQLLGIIWSNLQSVWQKEQTHSLVEQRAVDDILAILEPSIWKIFGYSAEKPRGEEIRLQDAIEVLLSSKVDKGLSDAGDGISTITPRSNQLEMQPSLEDVLGDSPELIRALFPDESLDGEGDTPTTGRWEMHFETSDDLTVVGVTRVFQEHEDEDIDTSRSMIYAREVLPVPLPDIIDQIESDGKRIKYSKGLEDDILRQLR